MCLRDTKGFARTFKLILYGRKDTHFVKSAWPSFHLELKAHILPLLEENNKRIKWTYLHTHTKSTTKIGICVEFSFKIFDEETFTYFSSVFIVDFEHCIIS